MSASAPALHSLHSTADVLIQTIIMNMLDGKDLLRFQRCSRRMLQLADSPAAWRQPRLTATLMIDVESSKPLRPRIPRHAALSVCLVVAPNTQMIPAVWRALLQSLEFGRPDARLHGFSTDGMRTLSTAQLCEGFALPSLSQLRVLRLVTHYPGRNPITTPVLDAVGRLSSLRCCALLTPLRCPLDPLANCAHLHTLHMCDSFNEWHQLNSSPSLLPGLAAWSVLRTLTIDSPKLHGAQFRAFFCAPRLAVLEHLCINQFSPLLPFHGAIVTDADVIAVFSALTRLQSLKLMEVKSVDTIVMHLAHAPLMQRLLVKPALDRVDLLVLSSLPSPAVLAALQAARPSLVYAQVMA